MTENYSNTSDGMMENDSSKIINYIIQGIVQKRFHSGDKLPTEVAFCELTGTSRNCVREAMKILNANQIVKIIRGSGTFLSSPEDISVKVPLLFKILMQETCFEDIYIFRETLEIGILRLVIRNCTEEDLSELDEINENMHRLSMGDGSHQQELAELDCRFHLTLAKAAHNKLLYDVYEMIFDIFRVLICRNFHSGQSGIIAYNSHVSITEAVRARDLIQAIYATRESVTSFENWVDHSSVAELLSSELLLGDAVNNKL